MIGVEALEEQGEAAEKKTIRNHQNSRIKKIHQRLVSHYTKGWPKGLVKNGFSLNIWICRNITECWVSKYEFSIQS